MYVKPPPKDLNSGPCPQHPTDIYTCGVTTTLRVHDGIISNSNSILSKFSLLIYIDNL